MANTTLKDITLDDGDTTIINDNVARKESFLSPMPLYLNDSDNTDVFDFGGALKVITLTGSMNGTVAEQKTFIESVQDLIQGHQDVAAGYPLTFVDDLRGTLKVKVLDFESTKVEGHPTRITWSLKLVEASVNA